MKRTGPTPEAITSKAIRDYLTACHLGKLKRNNVGQVRMGPAPTHPWQRDTRRLVRFGEVGEADLSVELTGSPRVIFIEVKSADWNPPHVPRALCAASTLKAYRHHLDQVAFQDRQNARGNIAFFARSPLEVYHHLLKAGFLGLPVPEAAPKAPSRPIATRAPRTATVAAEKRSQK